MGKADVSFTPIYYSISHTRASVIARLEYGARYIKLPTLSMNSLKSEAARFPAPVISKIYEKVHEIWGRAKTIHITAENGTDVRGKILSKFYTGGMPHFPMQEGEFLAFGGAMGIYGMWPGGEEGDPNGEMYFDAAHMFVGKLEVPLKYVIRKGRVVEVEGGKEAEHFRNIVKNVPNGDHLAEWMIGLNPKARIILDQDVTHVEAHRHAGSLHTAIGNSKVLGGTVYANVHLDNFIIAPTMTFVGRCWSTRALVVLDHPEVKLASEYGVSGDGRKQVNKTADQRSGHELPAGPEIFVQGTALIRPTASSWPPQSESVRDRAAVHRRGRDGRSDARGRPCRSRSRREGEPGCVPRCSRPDVARRGLDGRQVVGRRCVLVTSAPHG